MKEPTPKFLIKKANIDDVIQIRHIVMWPDKDVDFVRVPEDDAGQHFGVYLDGRVISVISVFVEQGELQFRKFATLNEFQGQGYGTALLKYVFEVAAERGIKRVWCNARSDKSGFYKRFGMEETEQRFTKAGVDYIIMERFLGDKP